MVQGKISKFAKEFRKSLTTSVIAAFGFLTALVWRDFITEYVEKITTSSPVQGKLASALIITILGVIAIVLITPGDEEKESPEKERKTRKRRKKK